MADMPNIVTNYRNTPIGRSLHTASVLTQSIYTPDFCYATTMIIVPFNFRNGIPKVHEIPGSIKCPVTAWEKFIEKRPKKYSNSDSAMFIRPVGTGNDPCNDHESGKFLSQILIRLYVANFVIAAVHCHCFVCYCHFYLPAAFLPGLWWSKRHRLMEIETPKFCSVHPFSTEY